jgi:putative membrane protein
MSRALVLAIVAASSVPSAVVLRADQAPAPMLRPAVQVRGPAPTPDGIFVAKAADAAATLLELARLGTARAADADVKVLAKRVIEEQNAIAEGIAELARARRVELPTPPAAVRQETAALARQSGPAFDRAFVAALVKAHDAAIALFAAEAADGRDDDIKEWAARQLPALRERLAKARALRVDSGS